MKEKIIYRKDMRVCCKHDKEVTSCIETPAVIDISCDYEINGFCVWADECDFIGFLDEKDVKELNG